MFSSDQQIFFEYVWNLVGTDRKWKCRYYIDGFLFFSPVSMFHSPHYTFNKHYSIADCFSGKTEDVRLHGVFRLRLVFILKFELKRETISE
jgi:hypothetical protein